MCLCTAFEATDGEKGVVGMEMGMRKGIQIGIDSTRRDETRVELDGTKGDKKSDAYIRKSFN